MLYTIDAVSCDAVNYALCTMQCTMHPIYQIALFMLDTKAPNIMLATLKNVRFVSQQVKCVIMMEVIKLVRSNQMRMNVRK